MKKSAFQIYPAWKCDFVIIIQNDQKIFSRRFSRFSFIHSETFMWGKWHLSRNLIHWPFVVKTSLIILYLSLKLHPHTQTHSTPTPTPTHTHTSTDTRKWKLSVMMEDGIRIEHDLKWYSVNSFVKWFLGMFNNCFLVLWR